MTMQLHKTQKVSPFVVVMMVTACSVLIQPDTLYPVGVAFPAQSRKPGTVGSSL